MLDPTLLERRSLEAARRGDVAAFNALVELHQRLVFNVAYRILGNPDEAADAAQEAFVSAFRAVRDFRGENVRAWLLRIAVNACYDQLRRDKRQRASSLEALSEAAEMDVSPPDRGPGPEEAALTTETAEQIQAALDRLPDDQRAIVVLCDVHGLSYEEAAESLEVAVGTVKSRLSRARARLRDDLTARGELPGASRRPHSEGLHST